MTSTLFIARTSPGFQLDVGRDPRVRRVRKRALRVSVTFASSASRIATPEGTISVSPDDAIIVDDQGRQWAVDRSRFEAKYAPVSPLQPGHAGAYTSLPVEALAMQMTQPFQVQFADGISELQGGAGDWLLDYGDGSLGVVADDVFRTIYDFI